MLQGGQLSTQAAFVQILKSGFAQAGIRLTAVPETFNALLLDTVPRKATQASCQWTFLYLGAWLLNGSRRRGRAQPQGLRSFNRAHRLPSFALRVTRSASPSAWRRW